jgi:GNAT superfamily N-acetyltransferase
MTAVTYRSLCAEDFPGVQQLALESWRTAYEGIYDDAVMRNMIDTHYSAERLARLVPKVNEGRMMFDVAVRDGEVLGLCVVVFTAVGAELSRLYLLPKSFGTGIAWGLIQRAEQFIRERGFHSYHGWVQKDNRRALRFYVHVGGHRVPELDRSDELCMQKALTSYGTIRCALLRLRLKVMRRLGMASQIDREPHVASPELRSGF